MFLYWIDIIQADCRERHQHKYGCENKESIKDQFIQACIRHKNAKKDDVEEVKKHIYVVTFEKNDIYFLGLEAKEHKWK